eukprot:jgi/Galph1/1937/GphlegSOOS_G622.1
MVDKRQVPGLTPLCNLIDKRLYSSQKASWETNNFMVSYLSYLLLCMVNHLVLKSHESFMKRLDSVGTLEGHRGCVNRLAWNESGTLLVSGSDDLRLLVWDVATRKIKYEVETGHLQNIFGVRFIPCTNDRLLASGSMDNSVRVSSVDERINKKFEIHDDRVKTVDVEFSNPNLIFSGSEDGTVKQIDLRSNSEPMTIVNLTSSQTNDVSEVKSAMLNQSFPLELVVSSYDPYVRLYDRRMVSDQLVDNHHDFHINPKATYCPSHLRNADMKYFTTFSCFNQSGSLIAATYCYENVYIFDVRQSMEMEPLMTMASCSLTKEYCHRTMRYLLHAERLENMSSEQYSSVFFDKCLVLVFRSISHLSLASFALLSKLRRNGWPGDISAALLDIKNGCEDQHTFQERFSSEDGKNLSILVKPIREFCYCFCDLHYLSWAVAPFRTMSEHLECQLKAIIKESESKQEQVIRAIQPWRLDSSSCHWWCREKVYDTETTQAQFQKDRLLWDKEHMQLFIGFWIMEMVHLLSEQLNNIRKELEDMVSRLVQRRMEEEARRPEGTWDQRSPNSNNNNNTQTQENKLWNKLPSQQKYSCLGYCRRLIGHGSMNTDIKEVSFMGDKNPCILSGSDDGKELYWKIMTLLKIHVGRFYIWSLRSGRLVNSIIADNEVVNCVLPHPYQPMIATSGIDNNIKLWMPIASLESMEGHNSNIDVHIAANLRRIQRRTIHEFGINAPSVCSSVVSKFTLQMGFDQRILTVEETEGRVSCRVG